ncbi:hypothetical protein SAMN04488063_1470 [Halopelagius inordinatus]|uniref:DUF7508 domain-containing protein n=1 Tax=Halopelagius inordinatus TaxID=553467 RepID=A0A1I2P6C0_9EURY|nr:hypothetical protein [Halopelagius inordinatus]SFG11675.1 hypothetical protein SAMN04488063_1470 [Halopelagius inordinatus]
MSLRKRWRPLTRSTVGETPDAYGVVEFGDEDGAVIEATAGLLPDVLREELSYGDAAKVRWKRAQSKSHADRLLDDL